MNKLAIKPKKASLTESSEIRRHYFLDDYVIISPKRHLRPDALAGSNALHTTETTSSPAIEKDESVFEIKNPSGGWFVKVINNKFPALTLNTPKAYGKQEVVIETPEHNVEFSQLPIEQIERIFEAFIARQREMSKIRGIHYVSIFKNDGPKAGASIAHAHSQIIGLPIVPPKIAHEAALVQNYMNDHNSCPYCDIIEWEQRQRVRVIFEDKNIIAISPYASKDPFAVWLMPKKHCSKFASLTKSERHSLAVFLKNITAFLDSARISFNFFLQDALPPYDHHFILKVEPRQTVWAGLELGTGIIINPMPPETATLWYKGKIK